MRRECGRWLLVLFRFTPQMHCPFLALKAVVCDRHLNSDRLSLSTVPDSGTGECSRAGGHCIICVHASVESMGRLDKVRGLKNEFWRRGVPPLVLRKY